jgi:glutamate/tyrosine decarboxylase-like PLP-dependent enzyme
MKKNLQEEMFSWNRSKALLEQAKSYAFNYMDGIQDRNVFPVGEAIQNLAGFDEPMPERAGDPSEILKLLHTLGSPATAAHIGGRYFGFVIGGSLPIATAAGWLADAWDQNAAMYVTSPLASQLESVCEKWVVDLLGLPDDTAAGFVGGSSTATLCGLAAARNAILKRLGWDVGENGLFGAPSIRVIVGGQAHSTVYKALSILGLGRARVDTVPVDDQGRMIVGKIPILDSTCLVIVQAGNVNSGAFDPVNEICDLAREAGAWVHIDGAFGLWAAGSREKKYLVKGIEKADSWSVDAHKTLNALYDSGIVLCSERGALLSAMQMSGAYIPASDKRDNMNYTLDMSRRARGIELWAVLKSLGREGVEELVDRLCGHAVRFASGLEAAGFDILNEVVFNQVLVRCDTPDMTRKTLENIQHSSECWCGGTTWMGEPAIRISVCSWATTAADIDRSVRAFVQGRTLANR